MSGEDIAIDFAGSDGPYYGQSGFCGRIVLKLSVVYLLTAYWSWEELRYRTSGIEVPAEVKRVGRTPKGLLEVRYTFRDPTTRAMRHNTVAIQESQFPESGKSPVQYLPGENPQSRLLSQARPAALWIFIGINSVLAASVATLICYVVWEANRPYVTPQGRMVAAYRKRHEPREAGSIS
jgi:hypothetical protein